MDLPKQKGNLMPQELMEKKVGVLKRCLECGEEFLTKYRKFMFCSRLCGGRHAGKKSARDPVLNFWSKVSKTASCWNWIGNKRRGGYGRFLVGYKSVVAHRFSWVLHNGEIPKRMLVLHKCDNPSCVNPLHLELRIRF